MINAPNYTFFGAGHGIGRPRQADSERAAATKAQAATQANRLCGARFVYHRFDNAQSCRTSQGHARVAG